MDICKHLSDDMTRPRCAGVQFNDLASLVAGVKSVVYTSVCGREEARILNGLCSDLGLDKLVLADKTNVAGEPVTDLLIGTNIKKMRAGRKAYANVLSLEWGVALDYPECCVRSYISWRKKEDLVRHIHSNSPRGAVFPFWMNNVFNYYSRLSSACEQRDFMAFSGMNRGLERESIIPWHPCSYLCPGTLKKGKRIYEVLEHYMPLGAAARRTALSKPVVFWDKFIFAVLNGSCVKTSGGFAAKYEGLSGPRSLVGPAAAKMLAGTGTLKVSAGGKITHPPGLRLPGNSVFLPFVPLDTARP